jgi:hypothetical protein
MRVMNRIVAILSVTLALTATARADFSDNFDSYADNTAFAAAWTINAGAGLVLNTAEYVSAPNSVVNPGTAAASSRIQMANIPASQLDYSFEFYDYSIDYSRDYGMAYSRAGAGGWGDGLNNLLAIGKFNNIVTTKYFGRVSTSATAVYGDGASTPVSTWFALGGGPDRSVGWHTAEITGAPDPNNAGMVIYKFYIDGVLGGSVANVADFNYNWVVLGSGLSTTTPIAFDDVSVVTIPEPSALVLGLLGVFGLALGRLALRRR